VALLASAAAAVLALFAAAASPPPGPAPLPGPAPPPDPPGMDLLRAKRQATKAARSPSTPCPFLADDAKPVVDVPGTNRRAPFALYPLGFSKGGRFAWLETSQSFDDDQRSWTLHVVDLDRDRALVDRVFFVHTTGVGAMCAAGASTIARLLEQQQIDYGTPPTLAPADDPKAPPTIEVVAGKRDPEMARTPYRVLLRGPEGSKQLGRLWRVESESGEAPRAAPVVVGLLRSPFEPRVAVLATQKVIGVEAVEATMVTVLGGRLDRGWRKEAP